MIDQTEEAIQPPMVASADEQVEEAQDPHFKKQKKSKKKLHQEYMENYNNKIIAVDPIWVYSLEQADLDSRLPKDIAYTQNSMVYTRSSERNLNTPYRHPTGVWVYYTQPSEDKHYIHITLQSKSYYLIPELSQKLVFPLTEEQCARLLDAIDPIRLSGLYKFDSKCMEKRHPLYQKAIYLPHSVWLHIVLNRNPMRSLKHYLHQKKTYSEVLDAPIEPTESDEESISLDQHHSVAMTKNTRNTFFANTSKRKRTGLYTNEKPLEINMQVGFIQKWVDKVDTITATEGLMRLSKK